MAPSEPSLEAYSKVVEAIYDCALNPDRWREALRLISNITHSSNIFIGTSDYDRKRLVSFAEYGYDPAFLKVYLDKYADNPLITRTREKPLGQAYTFSMLRDVSALRKTRFYHEWIKAQRFGSLLGVGVLRSSSRGAGLAANRQDWQPPYGKRDLQLIRLLAPHLCRTVAISDVLDQRRVASEALEGTLDALSTAVYLVDGSGRVTYMNAAAERQIRSGNALRILGNRLAPVSHEARTAMTAAIAGAIADEAAMTTLGTALALPGRNGSGLVATVLPLGRGERYGVSGAFGAAVAVFVQDPSLAPVYPGRAFAKLYGLTQAELRVLLAIAPGLGVKDAAAMLGIGEVTARTHLQHIFFKTGTSKQTELLNLLKNSTPPVNIA
jgi:DNA-binding CsgD family transcriptional regulator